MRGSRRAPGLTSDTPLYSTWEGIKQRCHNPRNPSFPRYGGRGIEVCERWRESFPRFAEDMGPKPTPGHSIDRIDNAKGYEPGNCRWATMEQQVANKRVPRGQQLPQAILTEDSVFAIRRVSALNVFTRRQLAKWFGVHEGTITGVALRKNWRHVP